MKTYVGNDGKIHFTDSSGADTVLPFKKVENVSGEVFGNTNTVELGFQPDFLFVEFGNSYEIKRMYSIYYSSDNSGLTILTNGFRYSFNAGNCPCRYRAVKFTD